MINSIIILVLAVNLAHALECPSQFVIQEIEIKRYAGVFTPQVDKTQNVTADNMERIPKDFVLSFDQERDVDDTVNGAKYHECTYESLPSSENHIRAWLRTYHQPQEFINFTLEIDMPSGTRDGWGNVLAKSRLAVVFEQVTPRSFCELNQNDDSRATLLAIYDTTQSWGSSFILFNGALKPSAAVATCRSKDVPIKIYNGEAF